MTDKIKRIIKDNCFKLVIIAVIIAVKLAVKLHNYYIRMNAFELF